MPTESSTDLDLLYNAAAQPGDNAGCRLRLDGSGDRSRPHLMNPMELVDHPEILEIWPNCSVPDCRNKVWLGGVKRSTKCLPHTIGIGMDLEGHSNPAYFASHAETIRRETRLMEMARLAGLRKGAA